MSTPVTRVYFCSGTGLRNNYEHSRDFADLSEQLQYFSTKVAFSQDNYMYLRKSYPIKINRAFESCNDVDYLYFQNGVNAKWYFYFVTDAQYINDNTTELTIELDVIQTYMHDFTLQRCFIDRMHTATDQPGDNIVEENLDLGEYRTIEAPVITAYSDYKTTDLCIMVMSSVSLTGNSGFGEKVTGNVYDKIFSGHYVYACLPENIGALKTMLNNLDSEGKTDAIVAMWMYPRNYVKLSRGFSWGDGVVTVESCMSNDVEINRPADLDGYVPRNKKLLTYPYQMLYVNNNNGGNAKFRYEKFKATAQNPNITFNIYGSVFPDGGLKMCPRNYNGKPGINFEEGITLNGFPTCAWNSDYYKIWLAQNQNSNALTYITGGAQMVAGAALLIGSMGTGALVGGGMALNGMQQIAGQIAKTKDVEVQPPQARGNQSSNINTSIGAQSFEFWTKCIDYQHANIIDDYFTAYGYKINKWGTPNIKSRKKWNYIKTIGSCVKSSGIPVSDLEKIDSIFNNGITFWHSGYETGAYELENPIENHAL